MNKKIISILFAVILCFCMTMPAFAVDVTAPTSETEETMAEPGFAETCYRLQDLAKVFDKLEREELNEKLDEISHKNKLDITVCFTNSLEGKTIADYAEEQYENYEFGYGENKDGIMLLISFEKNEWYIATRGYAIQAFTDAGIQYIGEKIKPDLADGNYYDVVDTYIAICDQFITDARNGNPYGGSADTNGTEEDASLLPPPMWILISIGAGVIVALIVVGSMKKKLKTVNMQSEASSYLRNGSLNITESNDIFLYSNVTRSPKSKNDSSTHESSSGNTYGGGGGKF